MKKLTILLIILSIVALSCVSKISPLDCDKNISNSKDDIIGTSTSLKGKVFNGIVNDNKVFYLLDKYNNVVFDDKSMPVIDYWFERSGLKVNSKTIELNLSPSQSRRIYHLKANVKNRASETYDIEAYIGMEVLNDGKTVYESSLFRKYNYLDGRDDNREIFASELNWETSSLIAVTPELLSKSKEFSEANWFGPERQGDYVSTSIYIEKYNSKVYPYLKIGNRLGEIGSYKFYASGYDVNDRIFAIEDAHRDKSYFYDTIEKDKSRIIEVSDNEYIVIIASNVGTGTVINVYSFIFNNNGTITVNNADTDGVSYRRLVFKKE